MPLPQPSGLHVWVQVSGLFGQGSEIVKGFCSAGLGGAVREQAHPSTSPSSWYAMPLGSRCRVQCLRVRFLSKLVYETVEMLVSDTLH